MPWTKLKNIILAILAATNLCLLLLVGGQAIQGGRMEAQARESAIQFLRNRGVEVDESIIPQRMELEPQAVERDMEGEERVAAALLQGSVTAESRGGEVYRYYNENGSVQFHSDGAFSAQLDPSAFPLGEDRRAGCLALMEGIGFSGAVLEVGVEGAVFRQTWQKMPLFTQQVSLSWVEEGLASISAGRLLVGRPLEDSSRRTVSVATALIHFLNGVSALGDVCNRIDAIEPGYVTAVSLSGPTALTPVWRVTTDTGAYQLDTVTGGVAGGTKRGGGGHFLSGRTGGPRGSVLCWNGRTMCAPTSACLEESHVTFNRPRRNHRFRNWGVQRGPAGAEAAAQRGPALLRRRRPHPIWQPR